MDITLKSYGKRPPSSAVRSLSVTLLQVPSKEDGVSRCAVIKRTGMLPTRDLIPPPNVLRSRSRPSLLLRPPEMIELTLNQCIIELEMLNKYATLLGLSPSLMLHKTGLKDVEMFMILSYPT